jgi:hypothetical protein
MAKFGFSDWDAHQQAVEGAARDGREASGQNDAGRAIVSLTHPADFAPAKRQAFFLRLLEAFLLTAGHAAQKSLERRPIHSSQIWFGERVSRASISRANLRTHSRAASGR